MYVLSTYQVRVQHVHWPRLYVLSTYITPYPCANPRGERVTAFAFRTAEVCAIRDRFVIVDCPYCGDRHAHAIASIGSKQVVAGCHAPHQPRLYSIHKPEGP